MGRRSRLRGRGRVPGVGSGEAISTLPQPPRSSSEVMREVWSDEAKRMRSSWEGEKTRVAPRGPETQSIFFNTGL